ncbi:hypothetical protein EZ428_15580 [Pedobacter frigiditerrae]|jgi:hypothetical protein|uniref:Uncharacterized protein n=1 Tax=Pedobacter frigiditerrae TaxID=2530452 RepID=A0A4R0MQG6_9SPHI|nr:hypothetical protein [Pedobacter frigiditerrae]RZK60087.1 MAG: hypothetical protein EOO91_02830 [Pedobacter sp.]TCC89121.1 hypothetical protein EZ428_15580 [Pedobacter frigiditerrae]
MNSTSLEITEKEYCIKLSKETFDLSLIRQLIKRIQAEELFFSRKNDFEEDLISRSSSEFEENFDRLDDK